ncbi:hypothetical protein AVEN_100350-1 [Araneus ventricosus]|uniref:Uncharacterized protein n=1 Tax=Araneus ventricosus TaxID=182803 RepID=A0A4Y2KSB8_ARAVE|nr:hypothetical protein AVEN_100350-1 [Araneus ventricosus]
MVSSSCMTMPGPVQLSKLKNCSKSLSGRSGTSPYNPDLVPSDYLPFPKLKELLSLTWFFPSTDVETAALNWLSGQGCGFYQAELNNLACIQINT